MNQVLLEVLESRVDRLAGRVTRIGVGLTLAGGLVLGLGVWTLNQGHEVNRARQWAIGLQAELDSLRAARRAADLRLARDAGRLAVLEGRVSRLSGGVRHAELNAVRAWISRLESRIDVNESRLAALGRRLEEGLAGVQDSLKASHARLEAAVGARFAAAQRARAELADRHAALDRRVEAAEQRDRRRVWRRAVSDALSVVGIGVVVPHVLDHAGR